MGNASMNHPSTDYQSMRDPPDHNTIVKTLDKGHLSEQQSASENGNNPYPIYAAVDERSFSKVTEYSPATWFEFTPHEASFLGYGASVPMEYFGSEYKNGELKKQKEEKNMSYLQGLWGSAIGSETENEKVIKGMPVSVLIAHWVRAQVLNLVLDGTL
ncbi:hypothetical protein KIL84_010222 [Mauremys mutica]|uniref:PLA2c domain-containing protein n=1 Tax=Mauremys mutica TaxID=74926 RepID=A0A9D3XNF5_9SAUR|nr:hypothetical protein KIL84_010222 [Mauremys mutica]